MFATGIYVTERLIVEFASAIICFVLVWFMMKPYKLTREGSDLGLPLGFGFLGISFTLGALSNSPIEFNREFVWLPFLTKTFAFIFIAATYFFSGKNSKRSHQLGNITISLLIIALTTSVLLAFAAPQLAFDYTQANQYLRILNVVCLCYVAIYTLRSHTRNLNSTTIWFPFGFIFLAISQYSLLFWYIDSSFSAFIGSVILRFIGLGIFLFVACRSFYNSDKKG
jgi:hypothetical protein